MSLWVVVHSKNRMVYRLLSIFRNSFCDQLVSLRFYNFIFNFFNYGKRYPMVWIDIHYRFQTNNCLESDHVMQAEKVNYCRFHYGNITVSELSCFILNKWIWIMWGLCRIHILCFAMSMHRHSRYETKDANKADFMIQSC